MRGRNMHLRYIYDLLQFWITVWTHLFEETQSYENNKQITLKFAATGKQSLSENSYGFCTSVKYNTHIHSARNDEASRSVDNY